jgi:hypothetical protein
MPTLLLTDDDVEQLVRSLTVERSGWAGNGITGAR